MDVALALDLAARGYDAATQGRRTDGWVAAGSSANSEIGPAIKLTRNRARDLVRNNHLAANAVNVWASNLTGPGIEPRCRTGDADLDKIVDDSFSAWARVTEGFYSAQRLCVRAMVQDGESLLRMYDRRPDAASDSVLDISVLEADYLDESRDTLASNEPGARSYLGIEFDARNRRKAYWIRRQHPGESSSFGLTAESDRVAASDVIHLFDQARPGQHRGITWFAPVVMAMQDLKDFQDAALMKAKVEACIALLVERPDADTVPLGKAKESDGRRISELYPAMVHYLAPGEVVREFNASNTATQFEPFSIGVQMSIAAGLGLTYDILTGDLRKANYSSLRAGRIEMRRRVEHLQELLLIPALCQPVWDRWIKNMVLAGRLPAREYPVEWNTPAHVPVDPKREMEADILAVRSGRMTYGQFVSSWGYDPRKQIDEIKKYNDLFDEYGISLEVDPRRDQPALPKEAVQDAETED